MTADEQLAAIIRLKAMGAKRAKVGDIEVEFNDQAETMAGADMMQVLEKGIEQGRDEILRHLSDEQRASVEQKMIHAIEYGSS